MRDVSWPVSQSPLRVASSHGLPSSVLAAFPISMLGGFPLGRINTCKPLNQHHHTTAYIQTDEDAISRLVPPKHMEFRRIVSRGSLVVCVASVLS